MNAIPLPTLLIPATAALLLLSAILLTLGLRGRRINDHPVCRKCRFDLHGIYPDRDTCPECGRNLARPRAIRRGERRRRRWAVALGALLLLASLGAIGAGGYAAAQGANLNPWKPTWMLAMEARRSEPGRAAGALQELARRLDAGNLSQNRIDSLIPRALALQADPNQPWLTEWGDLVEAAWQHDRIDQPLYERYLRQTVDWEGALALAARDKTRRGETFNPSIRINGSRSGNRGNLWFSAKPTHIVVAGATTPITSGGSGMIGLSGGSRGMVTLSGAPLDAPEGKRQIEVQWLVSVGPPPQGAMFGGPAAGGSPPPMPPQVEWTITLAGETEFVPAESPLVTEIDDPSFAEKMRAAVQLQRTRIRRVGDTFEPSGAIMFQSPPMPVAFDIYWRAGELEWKVGSVTAPAIGSYGVGYGHGQSPAPAGFTATTVDIILRSNPEAALTNPDITEIWKGDLVFENIEVEWPEPPADGN